jgi:hypothetical protein
MTLEYDIVSVTEAIEYVWKEGMNGMEWNRPASAAFVFPHSMTSPGLLIDV